MIGFGRRLAAVLALFDRVVRVEDRAASPRDRYGEIDPSAPGAWSPRPGADRVRASIQPASARSIDAAGRRGATVTHTAWIAGDHALSPEISRVVDDAGRIYHVAAPSTREGGVEGFTRVDLVEARR